MWRKHSALVKGKLLVYWTHGSLQLPKLLLLAPGGHDGTFYRNFAGALGSDYCLVAPDYPGRGGSDEQRFNSIKSLSKTLALWLEQLGWEDLTLLGISFGGAVANELARIQEKRINRIILIATGEFSRPALRPLINMLFMPALVSAKVQRLYHRYIVTHWPVFNKNYPVRLPTLLKQGRAILSYKLPKKALMMPAVIIMLKDDPLVTRGSLRKLQHLYPNHIYTLLPVPHELPLKDEQYKLFFKVVSKYTETTKARLTLGSREVEYL